MHYVEQIRLTAIAKAMEQNDVDLAVYLRERKYKHFDRLLRIARALGVDC